MSAPSPSPVVTIPLFPLPLVLFPEARLPLHIFEPRYRDMLADAMATDRQFGIVCSEVDRQSVPRGTVGCIALVESVSGLPDGRSNILVRGTKRFEVVELTPTAKPYLLASVRQVADHIESVESLASAAEQLRDLITRVSNAARTIADQSASPPDWPDDPRQLAFAVAQSIDLDLSVKQGLLASLSPADRLRQLNQMLARVTGSIEERARVHERATSNGHGPDVSPA